MKKSLKISLIAILSALTLGCFTLGACGGGSTEVDPYDWTYQKEFVDPHDADMTIDGVLDEARWEGQKYLHHEQDGVILDYTTVMTEYGLYIGAKVQDPDMQWNARFNFSANAGTKANNSALWFRILGADVIEYHAMSVFNFYVDPKDKASRNQTHFDAKAVTNGDVDKQEATEMTAELFVSWEALHIDVSDFENGYPDYVFVNPHYRHIVRPNSADNAWIRPIFYFSHEDRIRTAGRFSAEGYINGDEEGAFLGDAGNGMSKSDGWDLTREKDGIVASDNYHSQALFFKDVFEESYTYTTTVQITDEYFADIHKDGPGHAGVCDMINAYDFLSFWVAGNSVKTDTLVFHFLDFENQGWHDTIAGYLPVDGFDPTQGIEITVIKENKKNERGEDKSAVFYYVVEGTLVATREVNFLAGKSCPGFYTLTRKAIYTNYSVRTLNETELSNMIAQYSFRVDAPGTGSGGSVFVNTGALMKDENGVATQDLELTITPNARYMLTGLTVTGTSQNDDYYAYAAENMQAGKLVIPKEWIEGDVKISAAFSVLDAAVGAQNRVVVTGKVTSGGNAVGNTNVLMKGDHNLLHFSIITSGEGNYSAYVIKAGTYEIGGVTFTTSGTYDVSISVVGYRSVKDTLTFAGEEKTLKKDYEIQRNLVGGNVSINSTLFYSSTNGWDYSKEGNGKLYASAGSNATSAYFSGVVSERAVIYYSVTTESLQAGEQPGVGIKLYNGSRSYSLLAVGSHIVWIPNNWNDRSEYRSLPVSFDTKKVGETYNFCFMREKTCVVLLMEVDGDYVEVVKISEEAMNGKFAYAFTTSETRDYEKRICVSNYSILTGDAAFALSKDYCYTTNVTIQNADEDKGSLTITAENHEGKYLDGATVTMSVVTDCYYVLSVGTERLLGDGNLLYRFKLTGDIVISISFYDEDDFATVSGTLSTTLTQEEIAWATTTFTFAGDDGTYYFKRVANGKGEYSLQLPKGDYAMSAIHENFAPVRMNVSLGGGENAQNIVFNTPAIVETNAWVRNADGYSTAKIQNALDPFRYVSGTEWDVSATLEDMDWHYGESWPSAGILVKNGNGYAKIMFRERDKNAEYCDVFIQIRDAYKMFETDQRYVDGKMQMRVVLKDGEVHLLLNGAYVGSLNANSVFSIWGGGTKTLGSELDLTTACQPGFCVADGALATFTDWSYTDKVEGFESKIRLNGGAFVYDVKTGTYTTSSATTAAYFAGTAGSEWVFEVKIADWTALGANNNDAQVGILIGNVGASKAYGSQSEIWCETSIQKNLKTMLWSNCTLVRGGKTLSYATLGEGKDKYVTMKLVLTGGKLHYFFNGQYLYTITENSTGFYTWSQTGVNIRLGDMLDFSNLSVGLRTELAEGVVFLDWSYSTARMDILDAISSIEQINNW